MKQIYSDSYGDGEINVVLFIGLLLNAVLSLIIFGGGSLISSAFSDFINTHFIITLFAYLALLVFSLFVSAFIVKKLIDKYENQSEAKKDSETSLD